MAREPLVPSHRSALRLRHALQALRPRGLPLALLLVLADGVRAASGDAATTTDSAALARERVRLEAAFDVEETACRDRFAVNDCLDSVRLRRREALAPLRARELALTEAERRERAAQHRRAIEAQQQALAQRAPQAASGAVVQVRPRSPGAVGNGRAPTARAESSGSTADAAQAQRERAQGAASARARHATQRAAAAERREQARATQERIEQRLGERAATGKRSVALPPPASAPR